MVITLKFECQADGASSFVLGMTLTFVPLQRKEAEKRAREKQQEAHQWLTQNFVRDGETGK